MRRIAALFLLSFIITGCVTGPTQNRPMASAALTAEAKQFISDPEYATVYIVQSWGYDTFDIYTNDKQVAQINPVQFSRIKLSPGSHQFKIDEFGSGKETTEKKILSVFDMNLDAGSMSIIDCASYPHPVLDRPSWFLAPQDQCIQQENSRLRIADGVQYCEQGVEVIKNLHWSGIEYSYPELTRCKFINNKEWLTRMKMVVPDIAVLDTGGYEGSRQNIGRQNNIFKTNSTNAAPMQQGITQTDADAFKQALQINTLQAYDDFILKYPDSIFMDTALDKYKQLQIDLDDRRQSNY
jgi:hypothetical protein